MGVFILNKGEILKMKEIESILAKMVEMAKYQVEIDGKLKVAYSTHVCSQELFAEYIQTRREYDALAIKFGDIVKRVVSLEYELIEVTLPKLKSFQGDGMGEIAKD